MCLKEIYAYILFLMDYITRSLKIAVQINNHLLLLYCNEDQGLYFYYKFIHMIFLHQKPKFYTYRNLFHLIYTMIQLLGFYFAI